MVKFSEVVWICLDAGDNIRRGCLLGSGWLVAGKGWTMAELTSEDLQLFCDQKTTLEDIKKAGWIVYQSSSGRWWFRSEEGKRFLPTWVLELADQSSKEGINMVRNQIKGALGIR